MADLDSAMDVLNSLEERERRARGAGALQEGKRKEPIGSVECFFSKLSVVAIKLEGTLRVGDIIEIGDEEEAVRQKVTSMQINRQDISEAHEGDSVGIMLKHKVPDGSKVYKMGIA